MNPTLFDASVPVFLRYLEQVLGLVSLAEKYCAVHGRDPATLLEARLATDMATFHEQVAMAANFSLRACYPLAGRSVPAYGEFAPSFDGLRQRVSRVCSLLSELDASAFTDAELRTLQSQAGQSLVSLPAPAFLFQYALPNFFFHLTVAYAVLRNAGVVVGKRDFDGFHSYSRSP